MDRHDVSGGEGDYLAALGAIAQPTLVVAIDSDLLYPPRDQQELVQWMPNAQLEWLSSPHGHDAFLINMVALNELVMAFLNP
jgi:homoserine O-acetyltransferase